MCGSDHPNPASVLFLSLDPVPTGLELSGILTGMPGCKAYISTLDLGVGAALTVTPTNPVSFNFSNQLFSPGSLIAAQAVAVFDGTFPLLNGETGGFVVSNGVRSTTQLQ